MLVDRGFDKHILLSGSANFLLLKSITESLAGRTGILELLNFILYGGYPKIHDLKTDRAKLLWFKNYVSTYIERDLRDLAQVGNIDTFHHVYQLIAFHSGNIMIMSSIAGNTGVSVQTIKKYISILQTSFQSTLLSSYHVNQKKQITKSPKIFCFDTGLMNYFLKNTTIESMINCMQWGSILETHVFAEIYKEIINNVRGASLYYWRTNNGAEVDFIIDYKDSLIPVEVKGGVQVKKQSLLGMKSFMESQKNKQVPFGIVLYRGDSVIYLDKRIIGIPLTTIF